MTAEEYIVQQYGETWLRTEWSAGDVMDIMEDYGKYCAEIALDDGFNLGFIENQRPSIDEWWSAFQKKEETKCPITVGCMVM